MLCCVCRKNRAVKMHEREADGKTVREYYCSACFARLFPEISFEPKSKRDEGGADDARGEKKERRCPFCGTGAREYYKTKLLGCPECYRYLFEEIKESVFAMQGDEPHRGKCPAGTSAETPSAPTRNGNTGTPEYLQKTVTSTRIRLARNVRGYYFPHLLSDENAREIVGLVRRALKKLDNFREYDIGRISRDDAELLVEKHLISPALAGKKSGAAFVCFDENALRDDEISVMANEEDHLREQYIVKGYDLYKAYDRLSGIDDALSAELPFAFDEKLGYLTACPSNLGTGLRASVMMFLPGLSKDGVIREILPNLRKNGLTVRGFFGEGSGAEGYSYQVSNERTLGLSEEDVLSHMEEVALSLTELEIRHRERMKKEGGAKLKDRCLRAYGTLLNCAVLPWEEYSEKILDVRLGIARDYFETTDSVSLVNFLYNMRPLSFRRGNRVTGGEEECNIRRAEIVGKVLPELVVRAL